MRAVNRDPARRGSRLRAGAAATVPVLAVTLAIIHPGAPVSQVDLNDGAVWLTSASAAMLGRYNPQIDELNAGLPATGDFDVLQDEQDVLLVEPGVVSVVDPAGVLLSAQALVPAGAEISMAAGTVAVTEPQTGRTWVRTMGSLGALRTSDEPDLDLGPGGAATVARDGTVLAVRGDGTVLQARPNGPAGVAAPGVDVTARGELAGSAGGPVEQVTAVGDVVVTLSGTAVRTPSGAVDLPVGTGGAVLQQPGPPSDVVLVASTTGLIEVPLAGGRPRLHPTGGSGTPAAPVRVGGCAHGAWATASGSYLELCQGSAPAVHDLEGMTSGDRLVFRVNRDVVVLNDTLRGRVWMPLESPDLREPNWTEIEPEQDSEDPDESAEHSQSTQNLQAECTADSAPPLAVDDAYGVRAGRTRILSVIDNDASSECGILAVSDFDALPEDFGTLTPVYGGRAFQLTTSPRASGSAEFTYTITDGRSTTTPSTATVWLTVHDDGDNRGPEQVRVGAVQVEQGAAVSYDVLPDFRDPDGDQLVLAAADVAAGGTVRTRQDGELTFQSDGSVLGRQVVTVLVSDGVETVEGALHVDIRPVGSLAPIIDPVHVVAYVDEAVVVRPLESVRPVSREPVRLAGVDEVRGTTIEPDLEAGTFRFVAPREGTYYVPFLVTATPQQAQGIARIDVRARPEEAPAPIAVLDVALLPPGGEVTIDPLANDEDPNGGVLAVQTVDVPDGSGLRVAVLKHQLLRITSTRVLTEPVVATYQVSNGVGVAVGQVLIQPIPASAVQQPPVVPNVKASVRTGGVVTVPVLEGAYDPDGDVLRLVPELPEALGPGEGLLFVSGDTLRYQAPATPREVRATFEVTDPAGNVTSATLTVTVHASDPDSKAPPRPRALTARVFEGETIRIDVPLTGIDPDGDGVYLLGQDRAPTKGRIVARGATWLEYEALPGELGTDTFTYAVEDWVGQRAVATIRVGIVPRPTAAAEVVSRNDDVTVRPGQSVEVRVLANDVDTGGGQLYLAPALEHADGIDARIEGRRIVVRAPTEETVLQVSYTALNERGGRDSAVLTVTVTADAPILPPIAKDVVVPATDTINRTSVEVDVLALAENPSGPLSDLEVLVHPSAAEVATVTERGTVLVTLVPQAQTLPYLLRNTHPEAEGLSTYAFITVPALGDFPPIRRPRAPELRVVAGDELVIPLAEQIQVAPGRTVRITDRSKVTATKSDGSGLVVDGETLRYAAPRSYAGPASISFEITDGALADSSSRTTTMTLPITVLAAEEHPPTFTPSVIEVGPGETATVDLKVFTSTPVGTSAESTTEYGYALASAAPPGFTVGLSGSVLTISVDPTVPKGTAGGVELRLDYGAVTDLEVQVDFSVRASSRPLARVVDQQILGVEGVASSVPVLTDAFNPFPGSPLTVVGAVVETPGAGTASVSGDQVSVQPADGFIGPMVTRFRVRDVTGDPDREVEGRITATVRGAPSTPAAPRIQSEGDRSVVVAWDAPASNGEPITGYRVVASPGGIEQACATTVCTIEGLTNDVQYTFTVTATNAVGTSDPSPASATARPDAKPAAPATPGLSWGNQSVTATWTAPENPGSPIQRYDIEISPAPPTGSASATTTSTSYTFTGLTNGTEYSVRVRAVNGAPEPGDWSGLSAPQVPAAPPGPAADVVATRGWIGSDAGQITVTWTPGPANGAAISAVQLQVNGTPVDLPAGTTSYVFDAVRGRSYAVAVKSANKAGWSPWASTVGEIWSAPGPVTGLTAVDAGEPGQPFGQGKLRVSWTAPAETGGQGISVARYRVLLDGVSEHTTTSTSIDLTGLAAGSHTVQVFAVNSKDAQSSGVSVSRAVTTVAQKVTLGEPDVSVPGQVTFTWSPGATGGTAITGYRYRVTRENGGADVTGTQTGTSLTVPMSPGSSGPESMTITVWAVNARGESAPSAAADTARPVPPEPEPEPDPPGGGAP